MEANDNNKDIVLFLLGFIQSGMMMVLGFFFGASHSNINEEK